MMPAEIPIWRKIALSPEEAASYTNLNVKLIRGLVALAAAGKIDFPVFYSGKAVKIPRASVEQWVIEAGADHHRFDLQMVERMLKNSEEAVAGKRGRPKKTREAVPVL